MGIVETRCEPPARRLDWAGQVRPLLSREVAQAIRIPTPSTERAEFVSATATTRCCLTAPTKLRKPPVSSVVPEEHPSVPLEEKPPEANSHSKRDAEKACAEVRVADSVPRPPPQSRPLERGEHAVL